MSLTNYRPRKPVCKTKTQEKIDLLYRRGLWFILLILIIGGFYIEKQTQEESEAESEQ
jgi:hypothetical protein